MTTEKTLSKEEDLDSLSFFNLLGDEDDVDLGIEDPNANIAPDILGDNDELLPLPNKEKEVKPSEDEDPNLQVKKQPAQSTEDSDEIIEDDDEDPKDLIEGDPDDDSDFDAFKEFGKALAKGGVLLLEDGEDAEKIDWNQDVFMEKFESTIETKAFELIENLALERHGEEGIQMIKDILINGVSIPQYLSRFQQEIDLEDVDLSDEGNKIAVMREYLARTGVDEDEAEDRIKFAVDNDKLDEYAPKYHQKLVQASRKQREHMAEQARQQKDQQEQFERQRRENYKKVLTDAIKDGELEGYPVTPKDATELISFIDNKVYTLQNGQKITSFEYKLAKLRHEDPKKFLAFAKLLQSDLDLAPVKRTAVTNETNEIFNELKNKTKKTSVRTPSKGTTNSFAKYFLDRK
jgi:hypothetical protein